MCLDEVYLVSVILSYAILHCSIFELIFSHLCVKMTLLSETSSHLYADNACISYKYKDFEKIKVD